MGEIPVISGEAVEKYKGKFDQGWDKLREETFARQKKLGVIPPDAELTPGHVGRSGVTSP